MPDGKATVALYTRDGKVWLTLAASDSRFFLGTSVPTVYAHLSNKLK